MIQDSLLNIYARVREKKTSYQRYNFERLQEEAFATFFDLAQEYTSLDNLFLISVTVPKEFFDLDSCLYLLEPKARTLQKVATSRDGLIATKDRRPTSLQLCERPCETEDTWVFPIRGNEALTRWIPFHSQTHILGVFEIYPKTRVDAREHFFFEKFTNRIGYNLHQKLLIEQNIEHIKFINQLVADIEHNVITPNLYYKLFLLHLKKCLRTYQEIEQQQRKVLLSLRPGTRPETDALGTVLHRLAENNAVLNEEWKALSKHYQHTSLFLETLFRRDHFEKGTYVLRKQPCNFRTEIIEPLLERYLPVFERKRITVDNRLENMPDEEVTLFVDKGLISQVFDNLFANAAKYTQAVEDQHGNRIKLISCKPQIQQDFFGKDIHGVRFDFFTTGKPLSAEEARRIFEEGYRAPSAGQERGGGHGLHFVRNVVEIHGGTVGSEPQDNGNLIFFVLPWKEQKSLESKENP